MSFLLKIKTPKATKEDIEDCIDYLFREIREVKDINPEIIPKDDYEMVREDVHREFAGVINALDKLEDSDHPLRDKFDEYRKNMRVAAALIFDTVELTQIFGVHRANDLEEELYYLHWLWLYQEISRAIYERSRIAVLLRLRRRGELDSAKDRHYLQKLENFFTKSKYCLREKETISEGGHA